MEQIKIIIIIIIVFFSIGCKSQKLSSKVTINVVNGKELDYSLYAKFTSLTHSKEINIEDIKGNENLFQENLDCRTAYIIRLQSEGFLSQSIKYYNKTCNDTIIDIRFEPIGELDH